MAHYSLTPRVNVLAERLLAHTSTLCAEHATILSGLDGDIAGIPAAVKPARRFYELMRQLPLTISADELIVGNQTRTRTAPFSTTKVPGSDRPPSSS